MDNSGLLRGNGAEAGDMSCKNVVVAGGTGPGGSMIDGGNRKRGGSGVGGGISGWSSRELD